jgi:nucleoside-diphosphate-sugar epimerase
MKVMVFGATGVLGRPLVRRLHERGDTVIGTTRAAGRGEATLAALGAQPVVCDALDGDAVARAVTEHRPDVIVNQLTALGAPFNPRRYREWIAPTNRLRAEGTQNLVDAAQAAGTRRIVSQSIAFAYRWDGAGLKTEDDPLFDQDLGFADAVRALEQLERLTLHTPGVAGVVLRYGWFYGPGTLYAPGGSIAGDVRRRRFPLVGGGTGVFSFIHVEDAAGATVAAIEREPTGVFNVVDDDPAPMRDWLPVYAASLGAPRPLRVPSWLARLGAAGFVIGSAQHLRGASNARARSELGWEPRWPSWRQGFAQAPAAETG